MTEDDRTTTVRFSELMSLSVSCLDDEVGALRDVLVSDRSWDVEHVVVEAGSWFFKRALVVRPASVTGVDIVRGELSLALTRKQLEASEEITDAMPVFLQRKQALEHAYGWVPIWPLAKVSGSPNSPPRGVPGPTLGDPSLRSLDELLGYQVLAANEKVGTVDDFELSHDLRAVRQVVIKAGSWCSRQYVELESRHVVDVTWADSQIRTDLPRSAFEAQHSSVRDEPDSG